MEKGREKERMRKEGRKGERKGFAGPMSNCFLRAWNNAVNVQY